MNNKIIRFQVSKPLLSGREKEYATDAIETGWISSSGKYIELFESAISKFLQIEHGIAVSNGTTALHLSCLAMGLKPGMDVIVPALTYVASANAVKYCGANPIFADVDPYTWTVTPQLLEKAWTPNTVGVIPVHLFGLPAPMIEINELCESRRAWCVEDCAESFGAKINDRTTGSFADASAFSFFGNKIISTGEGGMVFIKDHEKRALAKLLKGQGMDLDSDRRYWHSIVGYNYRMTNVAAAIGLGQVEMAAFHLSERRRIAKRYLQNLSGLQEKGLIQLPIEPPGYQNVYWLFSLVLKSTNKKSRQKISQVLLNNFGIETRPFFVPMHHLPMYKGEFNLPNADFLGDNGMNLPTYSGLTDHDVDEISDILERVITKESRL